MWCLHICTEVKICVDYLFGTQKRHMYSLMIRSFSLWMVTRYVHQCAILTHQGAYIYCCHFDADNLSYTFPSLSYQSFKPEWSESHAVEVPCSGLEDLATLNRDWTAVVRTALPMYHSDGMLLCLVTLRCLKCLSSLTDPFGNNYKGLAPAWASENR